MSDLIALNHLPTPPSEGWSREEFECQLRSLEGLYHIHHPFHVRMNSGGCSRQEVQGWVANRYYYQINIPLKDANVIANTPDIAVRQQWLQRLLDHDGRPGAEGGIEAWITLGEAVGLTREEVVSEQHVLPGVRFAVDAYVNFARNSCWQEAVCSSLTELFAPTIHQKRLDSWPVVYPWIDAQGYGYFQKRLSEARRDVEHGLAVTLAYFDTAERQQRAMTIVKFKLDILWSLLDAMTMAYEYERAPYHSC
ncbi:pyrroloquinoline-quinone synthase [Sinobacterium caligoides]|uniref:Pyrroloquinoline-quinone synthase n=1 Tax=Sinobacterium caligoides TaxID=933926 RepID=A0A3N2E0D8_9GAMM|nr:pyrroloquinoline-quinone synthase PqqC [Sinobacterium caligoides]ROS05035.1 pyrroloquinoline-quinone synthase [Sinobacterium caligoides]